MTLAATIVCVSAVALYFACVVRMGILPLLDLLLRRRPIPAMPEAAEWPPVSVHLAVYREHRVLADLIQSVLDVDYPPEALTVLVLDDSTGEDAEQAKAVVDRFAGTNRVRYANRRSRAGFKAGALNYGLSLTGGDLVAYFDADCKPLPSFLRRTVPYFRDPAVAAVQARFDYANIGTPLAQLQAAIFEWLFRYEIALRAKLGISSFYMGTAAVWRKSTIEAIGGWREQPFTAEDLDLAYRASAAGWRVAYQPDLVARTTAVEDLLAFRAQQRRWARSMLQVAADNFGSLWRAPRTFGRRVFEITIGLAHGSGAAFLLAVAASMIALAARVERTPLWIATQVAFSASLIVPPVMMTLILAQRSFHPGDWRARAMRIYAAVPDFLSLVTSFVFGLGDYLRAARAEFVVTPKGGEVAVKGGSHRAWLSSHAMPAAFEAVVGILACASAVVAAMHYPEAVLPQAVAGVSMLVSCARTVRRMRKLAFELRARKLAATFG